MRVSGFAEAEDLECCCKVLIVSKGANMILEQAAAKPLAKAFLSPTSQAGSAKTLSFRILLC